MIEFYVSPWWSFLKLYVIIPWQYSKEKYHKEEIRHQIWAFLFRPSHLLRPFWYLIFLLAEEGWIVDLYEKTTRTMLMPNNTLTLSVNSVCVLIWKEHKTGIGRKLNWMKEYVEVDQMETVKFIALISWDNIFFILPKISAP